jgi:hypothetical protein
MEMSAIEAISAAIVHLQVLMKTMAFEICFPTQLVKNSSLAEILDLAR